MIGQQLPLVLSLHTVINPKNIYDLTEQDRLNLKEYLKVHKSQLEAINEAIKIGFYREDYEWLDAAEFLMPDLNSYKNSTKLVRLQVIDLVNDGKIDESVELILRMV